MPNCENLEYTTTCNDDGQLEFEASNTSEEQEAIIVINLPIGTEIFDMEGNMVYRIEVGSGIPKRKIKIPITQE